MAGEATQRGILAKEHVHRTNYVIIPKRLGSLASIVEVSCESRFFSKRCIPNLHGDAYTQSEHGGDPNLDRDRIRAAREDGEQHVQRLGPSFDGGHGMGLAEKEPPEVQPLCAFHVIDGPHEGHVSEMSQEPSSMYSKASLQARVDAVHRDNREHMFDNARSVALVQGHPRRCVSKPWHGLHLPRGPGQPPESRLRTTGQPICARDGGFCGLSSASPGCCLLGVYVCSWGAGPGPAAAARQANLAARSGRRRRRWAEYQHPVEKMPEDRLEKERKAAAESMPGRVNITHASRSMVLQRAASAVVHGSPGALARRNRKGAGGSSRRR